ncbi:MAG: hypothetical protein IJ752_09705 [Alphaproteobacteria bacterium]|nr:hypothetical protein [Alphaproteobacteria bacterium]
MTSEQKEWKIRLTLDSTKDAALTIIKAAQERSPFIGIDLTTCRLAIHEAVLNAVKHGGGKAVLTAFGNQKEIRAEIRQQREIVFPQENQTFKGISLIRRYAREIEILADKKTLVLRFY